MSKHIIGVYPICNTASILVHEIDHVEDKVLASLNGKAEEWCKMEEYDYYDIGTPEYGFFYGDIFVPFCEVMRY